MNSLREQLIRDEGERLKVYKDSVGIETIGVGRNLRDKGISRAESAFLLDNDIDEYTAAVTHALSWAEQLDPVRREVLVNMAFNLGIYGLLQFKNFLIALRARDYNAAVAHMLDSKWAAQVGPRAHRLAAQIRTGVRQ